MGSPSYSITYVSPSLMRAGDHHARVINDILSWVGHELSCQVIAHRSAQINSFHDIQVFPVLARSGYWQICGRFQGLFQVIPLAFLLPLLWEEWLRFADLKTVTKRFYSLPTTSSSCWFFEIFCLGELIAVEHFLSSATSPPRCLIFVMVGFHSLRELQCFTKFGYVKLLRGVLHRLQIQGCQIVFDNAELASFLMSSGRALIYPYLPKKVSRAQYITLSSTPPTLVLPGSFRRNKNFRLALSALDILNKSSQITIRCKVQASSYLPDASYPWLHVLPEVLSDYNYNALIASATFVWCAFDPRSFCQQGASSGTLRDALLLGSIPLASPGTWMSRYLSSLGLPELVIPVDRNSPECIADALRNLLFCLPSLRDKLKVVEAKVRHECELNLLRLAPALG